MAWLIYTVLSTIIVFLTFYIAYLLKNISFFGENIDNLREEVEEYNVHLKSLYEMEIFYGDETIQGMIEHTTHLTERIKDFEFFYSLLSEQEILDEEEENEHDEPDQPKEAEKEIK